MSTIWEQFQAAEAKKRADDDRPPLVGHARDLVLAAEFLQACLEGDDLDKYTKKRASGAIGRIMSNAAMICELLDLSLAEICVVRACTQEEE